MPLFSPKKTSNNSEMTASMANTDMTPMRSDCGKQLRSNTANYTTVPRLTAGSNVKYRDLAACGKKRGRRDEDVAEGVDNEAVHVAHISKKAKYFNSQACVCHANGSRVEKPDETCENTDESWIPVNEPMKDDEAVYQILHNLMNGVSSPSTSCNSEEHIPVKPTQTYDYENIQGSVEEPRAVREFAAICNGESTQCGAKKGR
ncbi:hypothetical protein EJ08DRAFT_660878 [Tothia fuscella]|uniref:Uncharacterized protein n=1 Tax=Tothia fuscella TaxID=1048955 RepID=A0A9P4NRN6_9PEZI|nr:hypothetical protein EJ08DRAFT_660878 [Tothia fuscella]